MFLCVCPDSCCESILLIHSVGNIFIHLPPTSSIHISDPTNLPPRVSASTSQPEFNHWMASTQPSSSQVMTSQGDQKPWPLLTCKNPLNPVTLATSNVHNWPLLADRNDPLNTESCWLCQQTLSRDGLGAETVEWSSCRSQRTGPD